MKLKLFPPTVTKKSVISGLFIFLCLNLLFVTSCGVKGRPQAPLSDTPISKGSPAADEELKTKTKDKRP